MRPNTDRADWVLAGALVLALVVEVGCSAAFASEVCFYGSRKFSEGAQLSVACVTARLQPTVCTVIVCSSGEWVKRDPPQCTHREGCPPRAPR
jgi:hypothetical protein